MDLSSIDWAAVIQAIIALVGAIFGIKFGAEKAGVRLPLLSKPTEAERRMKLVARFQNTVEQLNVFTPEETQKLVNDVVARFGPSTAASVAAANRPASSVGAK